MYSPSVSNPETGYLLFVRAGNLLAQPFDPRSLRIEAEPVAVVSRVYSLFPSGAADFSVSNNGMLAYKRYVSRSQLAWVTRRGEVVSMIGPANVNLKHGRLSPDGTKIAASIFDVNRGVNDMWLIDAATGAARRVIPGPGLVDNPVWAPDSETLAFSRTYDSPPKLFLRRLGDRDADEPLPPDYFQVSRDWSRDGRFLAFTNTGFAQIDNELKADVWLIDMERGRNVVHLIDTKIIPHSLQTASGLRLRRTSRAGPKFTCRPSREANPRVCLDRGIWCPGTGPPRSVGGGTAKSCSTWLGTESCTRFRSRSVQS